MGFVIPQADVLKWWRLLKLIINSNIASLSAIRMQSKNQSQLNISLQRLSSGSRINSAKDDAAGLAITTLMDTQIRGMSQASRNINDAISMVQTGEGALGELSSLMQRGRELAVQAANTTNSATDLAAIQVEIGQLVSEVDRISSTAKFNNIGLFEGGSGAVTYDPNDSGLTPEQMELVTHLKSSWLEQSEKMLDQYFGIKGDGAGLEIKFVEGEPSLAFVSFTGTDAQGKGLNISLSLDLDDFLPSEWPNGGGSIISNDRIILHEMAHAVMARTTNMTALPLWFIEGAAELIHGADTRLYNDIAGASGASTSDKVASLMGSELLNDGSVEQYSAGYAAVRYLHSSIIAEGGTGIKEVFDYLEGNIGSDLDDAIVAMKATYAGLAYGTQTELQDLFDPGDAGHSYVVNLFDGGSLVNADTGAVGGADADGGARDTTADNVVPDILNVTDNPLAYFEETFPGGSSRSLLLQPTETLNFQVGADAEQIIEVQIAGVNSGNLGISNVDVTTSAVQAIASFDAALEAIVQERARFGGIQNRLESAVAVMATNIEHTSASRSRILDADFAQETAALTRANVLAQAGNSVIAQANMLPNIALTLLNA